MNTAESPFRVTYNNGGGDANYLPNVLFLFCPEMLLKHSRLYPCRGLVEYYINIKTGAMYLQSRKLHVTYR